MAKLKSGTRIYGDATIDKSVVVGSAVTLSSSGIQVTGISTLNNANATQLNVSGVSTLGGVKISSGIVSASSGIITYYGDGGKLLNLSADAVFNNQLTNNVHASLVGIGSTVLTLPSTVGKEYILYSINCSNVSTGNTEVNVIGSLDDLVVNEDLPFKNAESNFTTVGETISGNIKGIPFSGFRSGLCIGYTF